MNIVVLDGYTLNPGDLNWDELNKLGNVTVYDRTSKKDIYERSAGAEVIITNKTPLDEELFSNLPDLKYVGVLATGYNIVDVQAAKKRGIIVTNIPTYGTASVAQMTFSLLLELCTHTQKHSDAVHNGDWNNSRDFCFWNYPLIELSGKTMGIIGFGRIGQQVADIAYAFGMKVLAFDTKKSDEYNHTGFKWVELDDIFTQSDVVSLHCPLFPETKEIVNIETLRKMKKSSFLINTSRGPLINEQDLANVLNSNMIAGAGIDVLTAEPPTNENPLLYAKNCVITPHIAWATSEARKRLMDIAVENLKSFLDGNTKNIV